MREVNRYIVTCTDYFGVDYVTPVYLTRQEAKERIKDGRLLSVAEGRSRNYGQLWEAFKSQSRYGETAGRLPSDSESELIDYKNVNVR